LQKGPLNSGLVEEENSNIIKQERKTGVETMGLKRMVEDQVKEALI